MITLPQENRAARSTAIDQSELFWLLAITALGLALRAGALLLFKHAPESDELTYASMASNILGGAGLVDDMGNLAFYNCGYPLFVLTPVQFFFGESLLAARIANIFLGGVAIVLCHLVGREAGAGRIGRLLAAAFWALYLPASVYAVYLLKENLMTPLMLGVIWCALRLSREYSVRVAIVCGILLGLLALTGNSALVLAFALALGAAFSPATLAQRAKLLTLSALAAIALASPWLIRNTQALGSPVLNTNGGFNLYLGNNPAATGMFLSIAETPRGPTWLELRKEGEVQAANTLRDEALAWVRTHPREFLTLATRKLSLFWAPPVHQGKSEASRAEAAVRILWFTEFVALTALALVSLTLARVRTRQLAILWSAIVCYSGVHMLFYIIFRYREPIMPEIAIISAITIECMISLAMRRIPGSSAPQKIKSSV